MVWLIALSVVLTLLAIFGGGAFLLWRLEEDTLV